MHTQVLWKLKQSQNIRHYLHCKLLGTPQDTMILMNIYLVKLKSYFS